MTAIKDEPFGQYELLARFGEGVRGPVSIARARDGSAAEGQRGSSIDALYAVEVSAFAGDEEDAQRAYLRDVERTARIKHRNVIGVVDLGTSTAGRYVVMPYVEGCTLSELQERHRAIRPPRLVLAAAIDALHGLHAAHAFRSGSAAQPLWHGSLSPDHLWLGLDGACRVGGFGHARTRVQTVPPQRRSAAGYLAPEQLSGAPIDHRTDLFSLGVVLWNALTGKRLFHDRIEHMTMSNVLERKIPRPSTIGLSPPPAFDAIVMKSLERDPAHRFQGAAEMAGALQDAARGASCLAPATELAEWVATTFGNDLTARRRVIHELAARPHPRGPDTVVLPRLIAPTTDAGRDYLSLEELSRANDAPPRLPPEVEPAPVLPPPLDAPARPPRRHLGLVATAAFAVVASVLGWRWSVATAAAEAVEEIPRMSGLEVTVLAVRSVVQAPAPVVTKPSEPAPAAVHVAPVAPVVPVVQASAPSVPVAAASKPAPRPAPSVAPSRPPPRAKRAGTSGRPVSPSARPVNEPAEARPAEPPPEPTKPESPPRPTLESNPYIYNK